VPAVVVGGRTWHGQTHGGLALDPRARRVEKAYWEVATFHVLTGNQQLDHSRISELRSRHLEVLDGLTVQVLRLCQKGEASEPGS
jgi:hypothetical protein